jgi:hypothetical protein
MCMQTCEHTHTWRAPYDGWGTCKPGSTRSYQAPPEAGKGRKHSKPSEGAWPLCRLPASRTVGQQISVLIHSLCGTLLEQPQETVPKQVA